MSMFGNLTGSLYDPVLVGNAVRAGVAGTKVAVDAGLSTLLGRNKQTKPQTPQPKPQAAQSVKEQPFKKTLNTQAPRTNVNPKLLKSFSDRILTMEDDTSQGYSTNLKPNTFIKKFLPNYANRYVNKQFNTLYGDMVRSKEPARSVLDRFENKGITRQTIPGNDRMDAKLDPDAFRAEVLGGSDLAKRVVYWSGNNVLHNRFNNLPKGAKDSFPKMMKEYGVNTPHRTSIMLNTSNTSPGFNKPNLSINYNLIHDNPETKGLMNDFLSNGTADVALNYPEAVGSALGHHSTVGKTNGGRRIPTIRLKYNAPPTQPGNGNPALKDLVGDKGRGKYISRSDHYGLDGIRGKGKIFRNTAGILGTLFHEANHHEADVTDFQYGNNGDPGIHNLGFKNNGSYAGSSRGELTRAMQSGKLPVTKMLMDKVERLAPELIPDYNSMTPEVQLDTKAQIVAQLAEDPDLALATLKRWGAFNPDRPNREKGLAYYIPKAYLTKDTPINDEIINSLVGLNRSVLPDKSNNPRWRQYWNLTYPQLIAKNQNDRNNIV